MNVNAPKTHFSVVKIKKKLPCSDMHTNTEVTEYKKQNQNTPCDQTTV
jgi:hypothetical protein